jgi:NAD(P)-dependent dehydrogenase (short-subunit alcohol dehydrogenase family)
MKLNGKVVVITGAGNGMGREMAIEAIARGAKVFGVDISEANLKGTSELVSDSSAFSYEVLDITNRELVAKLPAKVIAKFGVVDALINNAGIIQPFVFVADLDFEHIDRVMSVNFDGPVNLVKAFLPELRKRSVAHIANVSSMGGYGPVPGQTIYGASKAAIKLFTEGLRSELKSTAVAVTAIYPGAIGTNIAANSGISMELPAGTEAPAMKMTPAPMAAKIMLDGIEADKARVFVGSDASMMDKLVRYMPVKAADIIYNQMKSLLPK